MNVQDKIFGSGYRTDIPAILSCMDIFLLPSLAEGSPVSLIEAMPSGLPVIATAVVAVPKVIINGKNGYIVPVNDLQSLTETVETILGDTSLAKDIANNALETVKFHFSIEKTYVIYLDLDSKAYNASLLN